MGSETDESQKKYKAVNFNMHKRIWEYISFLQSEGKKKSGK